MADPSSSPPWEEAPSGAPLGLPPTIPLMPGPDPDTHARFAVPEGERYEAGGLLGRGGMGEVRLAHDVRLGRDVAIKQPQRADPGAVHRLAREASLTARLEHPNIIPVFGAGVGRDGRPYYTMRLLRGRTLAEAAADAPTPEARMGLLRHLLAAADAVAYAHGQGVLHRDLKPANIMVGGFGETLVADWGLACTMEEAKTSSPERGGTPGWMSPEQARGEPPDPRGDVYSLGAILAWLLTGRGPPPTGAAPPVRQVRPDAPADVAAIADRALSLDPAARYPDAAAFAEDLRAWYEGRRVSAHDYTAWEIAGRFWAAYKAPLVVAALAFVAVGVAVTVGYTNTVAARDRAEAARADAEAAGADARRNLARALVAQARSAADAGRPQEAELLAAHSLALEESPGARGVLARWGGRDRFHLAAQRDLPACEFAALSADGRLYACHDGARLVEYDLDGETRELGRRDGPIASFAFGDDEGTLVLNTSPGAILLWRPGEDDLLLDALGVPAALWSGVPTGGLTGASGRGGAALIDSVRHRLERYRPCDTGDMPDVVTVGRAGALVVACSNGSVRRARGPGRGEPIYALTVEEGLGNTLAADTAGSSLVAIGTVKGRILVLDSRTGEVAHRLRMGSQSIASVALHRDRLAAVSSDGVVTAWDLPSGIELGRVAARGPQITWMEDGRRLRIAGARLEDWEVPTSGRSDGFRLGAGVAGLALSPDGERLAVAGGDGHIEVFRVRDGVREADLRVSERVAKDVAWSPDGAALAAAASGVPLRLYDTRTWKTVGSINTDGDRRVAWFEGLGFIAASYTIKVPAWKPGDGEGADPPAPAFHWWEMEVDATGRNLAALSVDGGLWLARAPDLAGARLVLQAERAKAVAPLGTGVLVAYPDHIERLAADGAVLRRWPIDDTIDLAVSRDERWFAAGGASGRTTLYATDEAMPRAFLDGHAARVASLAFSADGRWLYTGSWDETVRAWSLAEVSEPADALRERIERSWGRSVDDALDPYR